MTHEALPDEVIRLWPEGPPFELEGVGPEVEFRGPYGAAGDSAMLRNVSEPTLNVFRPPQWPVKRRRGDHLSRRRPAAGGHRARRDRCRAAAWSEKALQRKSGSCGCH